MVWNCRFNFTYVPSKSSSMMLIPVLVVLFTYGFKDSIRIGLLWFIGPFFIIGAWVVRNYLALNQFILFSTQGADPLIAVLIHLIKLDMKI